MEVLSRGRIGVGPRQAYFVFSGRVVGVMTVVGKVVGVTTVFEVAGADID